MNNQIDDKITRINYDSPCSKRALFSLQESLWIHVIDSFLHNRIVFHEVSKSVREMEWERECASEDYDIRFRRGRS